MVPVITTDRLLLRPLECADAVQTQLLFPHWEVVKLLAAVVPWPYPEDGAIHYYRDVALPAVERGDEWHWTLRLKAAPAQFDRRNLPSPRGGRQSRLLAGEALAAARPDDRGGRSGE